eukprot:SAG11_NODE_2044_length_3886_cov_2.256668_1_plen_168_part_00
MHRRCSATATAAALRLTRTNARSVGGCATVAAWPPQGASLLRPLVAPRARCTTHTGVAWRGASSAASTPGPSEGATVLFQLTGQDQLGIIADYSQILNDNGAVLLDIEQASCTTHSTFTLNFLIASPGAKSDAIMMAMIEKTQKQNIQVHHWPLSAIHWPRSIETSL